MLFNSAEFIFLFVPIVLIGYYFLLVQKRTPVVWLVIASLFYYGYWDFRFLALIVASIFINFRLTRRLVESSSDSQDVARKRVLVTGVFLNLATLGYFKYFNFFVENIEAITGHSSTFGRVILPIGLSFFTFQQIALLVDAYQGKVKHLNFWNHALFISFFPQLIAGPIVHHSEVMPQFEKKRSARDVIRGLSFGFSLFAIGLFKKVVIADQMARNATRVFEAADYGVAITFVDGWVGTLAYTLEIYYDFSAYSDMALGLALMFGISLPLNFNSPYQATSIIDFWRRWHITLSRFLLNYLYIPLGGSRKGNGRRFTNLMTTMLLGGLWHGAGWNFVFWGGLHGVYLAINHFYRIVRYGGARAPEKGPVIQLLDVFLTMMAVAFAWVFFKASTLTGATSILSGMVGLNGISLPVFLEGRLFVLDALVSSIGGHWEDLVVVGKIEILLMPLIFFFTWLLPNASAVVTRMYDEVPAQPESTGTFRLRVALLGILSGLCFALAVHSLSQPSEFIYYQF